MNAQPTAAELIPHIVKLAIGQEVTVRISGRKTETLIQARGPLKAEPGTGAIGYQVGDLSFHLGDIESIRCARYTPRWVIHL